MVFRGRQRSGSDWLKTGLIVWLVTWIGNVSVLTAETNLPQMARYKSTLNYTHDYPQGWFRIDRSNTDAARAELFPSGADSSSLAGSRANFLLTRIDSLEIKAVFLENPKADGSAAIMVNLGSKIESFNRDALNLLENRFQTLLLPPGAVVKNLETSVVRQGLKKILVLNASVTEPGQPASVSYHSLTVKGEGRSFTFTLRGTEAEVQRLKPVLAGMATSLDDNFAAERGISNLPRWVEIILIVLLALSISWLIIRLRDQNRVASRHGRRRGISFFQLFLIAVAVLVGLSYLLRSCQAG